MAKKHFCRQCGATMTRDTGTASVKCPVCRVDMVATGSGTPEAPPPANPDVGVAEPVDAHGQTGTGSVTGIKVARPIDGPLRGGAPPETTSVRPVAPKQVAQPEGATRQAAEAVRRRDEAEKQAQALLANARQEAASIVAAARQQAARTEAEARQATEQRTTELLTEARAEAETQAREAAATIQTDAQARAEELVAQAQTILAGAEEALAEAGRQSTVLIADTRSKAAEQASQESQRIIAGARQEAAKQAAAIADKAEQEARTLTDEATRKAADKAKEEAGRIEAAARAKAKVEAEKLIADAKQKAREVTAAARADAEAIRKAARAEAVKAAPAAPAAGAAGEATKPMGRGEIIALPRDVSPDDADTSADLRARRALVDRYAKREARFIMAGMCFSMVVLLYCVLVLIGRQGQPTPAITKMFSSVVLLLDVAMFGGLVVIVRGHYREGKRAIDEHRRKQEERARQRRETAVAARDTDRPAAAAAERPPRKPGIPQGDWRKAMARSAAKTKPDAKKAKPKREPSGKAPVGKTEEANAKGAKNDA